MNQANFITVLRFPLLVGIVGILLLGSTSLQFAAVPLILLLIGMDSLDGIIARRRHETTLAGSMLDIAADRAVEIVLWTVLSHRGVIPFTIPLVVILRGALTDSIRNAMLERGASPHGMMHTPLGRWLVAAPAMRSGYAFTKAAAFALLTLGLALQSAEIAAWHTIWAVGAAAAWTSLMLCLLRGLPVLVEGIILFQPASSES